MGEKVCLNADRSKVVPCDTADAAYVVSKEDANKLVKPTKPAATESKAVAPAEDKAVAAPNRNRG